MLPYLHSVLYQICRYIGGVPLMRPGCVRSGWWEACQAWVAWFCDWAPHGTLRKCVALLTPPAPIPQGTALFDWRCALRPWRPTVKCHKKVRAAQHLGTELYKLSQAPAPLAVLILFCTWGRLVIRLGVPKQFLCFDTRSICDASLSRARARAL